MFNSCNWSAKAESDNCILIEIDSAIDITNFKITLKDQFRCLILTKKIDKHKFKICTNTEMPMFADINNSVRYVEKSGSKAYSI